MDSVIRATIVYSFVLLLFRVSGKRTLAEVTPFDLVIALIISEAIQQALIDTDNSLTNALLVVTTLIALDMTLLYGTFRFKRLDRIINGVPVVVVQDGELLRERMRKERLLEDDIRTAAREQGLERLDQIKYAIVERGGTITIVPKDG